MSQNELKTSQWGSKYKLDSSLVPQKEDLKGIVQQYDQIDLLTQTYLKDLAALMGIQIQEMGHFDTSSEVRDLAIKQLEEEFPTQLLPIDFSY